MTIPGIQDFYDGMHHQVSHEMEHALHDANHGHEAEHGLHPTESYDLHLVHDCHEVDIHAHVGNQDDSHHQDQGGFLDHVVPALLHGATTGVVKFAAEMATDAMFSQLMLGESLPLGHSTHPLHVGSTDGEGFSHQSTGFTCAVVSQQMILNQFRLSDPQTGQALSEARLVYDATANGWLTDHGTSIEDLGKLLDHYGIDNHQGHDWSHLVHDLAAGHQVVIAVNADHLWNEHSQFSEFMNLFGNHPNHAIVVKGLRIDEHGKVLVIVNDPGQADGAGVEYLLEHFQSAVESTHMHYVATDHARPDWLPAQEIRALQSMDGTPLSHFHPEGNKPLGIPDVSSAMTPSERTTFLREI